MFCKEEETEAENTFPLKVFYGSQIKEKQSV